MRIGVKLLLTYLVIVGLIVGGTAFLLPHFVKNSVKRAEQERLDKVVQKQATAIGERLNRGLRARNFGDITAARQALTSASEFLVDETLLIVDDRDVVVRATNPDLDGRRLFVVEQVTEVRGETWLVSRAPLPLENPLLRGYTIVMIRQLAEVEEMAGRLTRRLTLVLVPAIFASLLIAGWLSREMVRRLRDTGTAVQALADGDLSRRVPEVGNDEITDLARNVNYMASRIQVLVEGLRRSEQARKELLVTCSHELRTPMTSITGFAEALRDGVVQSDERRQRYYQIIASESARLNRLITDLFDMAKLEAGQVDLQLQAMAVAPWLVEFAEGVQPLVRDHGRNLDVVISPEAERARIYGDRDRLDQVLTNLIGNAIRFSPPDGTVAIRAGVDGEDLLVEVADQGPGIEPEEQDRVFERFFQGSNNGAGHKGAGLGLAIVKSLVEAHGGRTGVQSAPGEGAVFWIRLKLLV